MTPTERHLLRVRRMRIILAGARQQLERFGSRVTAGEVFTHLTAELAALEGERITSAELAERSGQSPQNVSRWINRSPNLRLVDHPEDGRAKIVDVIEPALIEVFIDQTLKNDLAVIKESKESGRLDQYLSEGI